MTIHAVKGSGSRYHIQTRSLSCFCHHCRFEEDSCYNADVVGCWQSVQLIPKSILCVIVLFFSSKFSLTVTQHRSFAINGTMVSEILAVLKQVGAIWIL